MIRAVTPLRRKEPRSNSTPASTGRCRGPSKVWLETNEGESTVCFTALARSGVERVPLGDVVGLAVQVHAEKVREVWGGRLLIARRAPETITVHAVVSVLFHVFLLLSVLDFTFSKCGPISAVFFATWLVRESLRLHPDGSLVTIPPLLSWWCDLALWWTGSRVTSLMARSCQSIVTSVLVRCGAVALGFFVLDLLHGSPQKLLSGWQRGGLLKVHIGLKRLAAPRRWHRPCPPVMVDFIEQELPELLALRVALMKAGYKELMVNIWVGNFATETALSVVLPSFIYNSQSVRKWIHIVLDLCLPIFFCFQALHILAGVVASLELSDRLSSDPFVRVIMWVETLLVRWGEHQSHHVPATLREFIASNVRNVQLGWVLVAEWMSTVAMPLDYTITYVYTRLHTVRTSIAPLMWAVLPWWKLLHEFFLPSWRLFQEMVVTVVRVAADPLFRLWLLGRDNLFWGLPKFGGLGWWRRVGEFVAWLMAAFMHELPPNMRCPRPEPDGHDKPESDRSTNGPPSLSDGLQDETDLSGGPEKPSPKDDYWVDIVDRPSWALTDPHEPCCDRTVQEESEGPDSPVAARIRTLLCFHRDG